MSLYLKALRLAAKAIIVKEKVGAEEAKNRFDICLTCDRRNEEENKCEECGCFLDFKCGSKVNWNAKKLRNEITHCPLGKWGDLETANLYRKLDNKQQLKTSNDV